MDTSAILIHVTFAPDGTVVTISSKPEAAGAQQWFNFLTRHTTDCYQALSGGRGVFKVPAAQLHDLQSACAA